MTTPSIAAVPRSQARSVGWFSSLPNARPPSGSSTRPGGSQSRTPACSSHRLRDPFVSITERGASKEYRLDRDQRRQPGAIATSHPTGWLSRNAVRSDAAAPRSEVNPNAPTSCSTATSWLRS